MASGKKKKGFLQKLFSKGGDDEDDEKRGSVKSKGDADQKERGSVRSSDKCTDKDKSRSKNVDKFAEKTQSKRDNTRSGAQGTDSPSSSRDKPAGGRKVSTGARKISVARKKRKESSGVRYDPSQPLEFPATPELILEAHKRKSVLSPNEEWLLVELNEFECLVDSHEIIKIIAKDSKFFEVDPDELWSQFFEFVEDCPAYDEVINYDIWQEFRLKYYQC